MSAIGPWPAFRFAVHLSALGGKADMNPCRCPLSRAMLRVKLTCVAAPHESAFDPKLTRCALSHRLLHPGRRLAFVQNLGFRPVETHVHCKRTTCGCR